MLPEDVLGVLGTFLHTCDAYVARRVSTSFKRGIEADSGFRKRTRVTPWCVTYHGDGSPPSCRDPFGKVIEDIWYKLEGGWRTNTGKRRHGTKGRDGYAVIHRYAKRLHVKDQEADHSVTHRDMWVRYRCVSGRRPQKGQIKGPHKT